MNLDPDKQKRLIQLLGMLGSEHDGEVLNAARLAQRLLGSLALTWDEIIGGEGFSTDFVQSVASEAYQRGVEDGLAKGKPKPKRKTFTGYASLLLDNYAPALTEWESGFCESWAARKRGRMPSERELAIFERLAEKIGEPIPAEAFMSDVEDVE